MISELDKMRNKRTRTQTKVRESELDSIADEVTGMIIPNAVLSILFAPRNLFDMSKIGTDSTIQFNPNFDLSPITLNGVWKDIYIKQDFDDGSDLDKNSDFNFTSLKVTVFVTNSPWHSSEDHPLKSVELILGIAPLTKSWLDPFSWQT